MNPIDLALAAAFAVAYPIHGLVTWPKFVAAARAGKPGVRVRAFLEVIAVQWSLTAVLAIHWAHEGRSWTALGLGGGPGAAWGAWLVVLVLLSLLGWQLSKIRTATPEERAQGREQLGELAALLPHDRPELRVFMATAITAGCCEELFYRGFLPWLFGTAFPAWAGTVWPLVATTVLFGLGHAYQGAAGVVKTMVVGAIAAALVWWSGVLWPAIVLHALLDVHGGTVGWLLLRREPA